METLIPSWDVALTKENCERKIISKIYAQVPSLSLLKLFEPPVTRISGLYGSRHVA